MTQANKLQISAKDLVAPFLAGTVASVTGTAASIGIVLAAFLSLGASTEQTASAVFIMLLFYGLLSVLLSWRYKMPISIVWSTPGGALLVASGGLVSQGGLNFNTAVGAFMVSGLLVALTGFWPTLGRLVASIPKPIASAMLAGVIFSFCLAPFQAASNWPLIVFPAILVWFVLFRVAQIWAAPAAMVVVFSLVSIFEGIKLEQNSLVPQLVVVAPEFNLAAIIGISIPLYLVTMASQNVPGIAIMKTFGFDVPFKPVMVTTGLTSVLGSMFGGFNLNLAAITAAINANEQAHPEAGKRWLASVLGGVEYVLLALATPALVAFVHQTPRELILTVAGLALVGTITSALAQATEDPRLRLPAVLTFLVGASSVSFLSIGAAFWALLAGLLMMAWTREKQGKK